MKSKSCYVDSGKLKNAMKFFVYGTLRKGGRIPKEMESIITDTEDCKLTFYDAYVENANLYMDKYMEYPAVNYDMNKIPKENIVKGNLVESSNFEKTLRNFDQWEDYPTLYIRIIVDVFNKDLNIKEKALMYVLKDEEGINKIDTNDFLEYLKLKDK